MGSNRRKKTLTILLAAILGECAALLLVVFVLTSFGPAGSGNYPVAAGPLHIEENGGILSGDGEYNLPETISGGRETNNETVDETVRASENSAWDIDATIELVKNRVSVREKIRLEAEGANAVVYLPSANKADTVIKKMLYNGKTAVYDRKDTDIHIMDAENGGYLYIEYEILLSDKPEILSYTSDSVLLTNFLAVPAVYKNNAPLPSYSYSLGDRSMPADGASPTP